MKPWLGLTRIELHSSTESNRVHQAGVFPDNPVVTDEEWQALHAYYQSAGPAQPPAPTNKPAAKTNSKLFRPRPLKTSTNFPATTLVRFDTNSRAIYIGDANERTFKLVTPAGQVLRAITLPSAPIDALTIGTNLWVPLVGRTFPSDEWAAQLRRLTPRSNTWDAPIILSNLPRLSHASIADINADARPEIILSGFGHRVGKLTIWQQQRPPEYVEVILSPHPGALATHVEDLDGDRAPDILLLRGAAREGVFAFYNRGDHFDEKPIIQFPPTHGVSSWQILDFNRDGKTDLLISNGDIGDFQSKPRAYHGLRLYLGQGNSTFTEAWSFPMNGAYGMRAADFDNDGDLDIAAISFFPDFKNYPDESFLYLENKGSFNFIPYTFPFANQGRWLVMDAADIDADGDTDILLGNFVAGPRTIHIPDQISTAWRTNRANVLLLENTTR
jgi:hypothetical protein